MEKQRKQGEAKEKKRKEKQNKRKPPKRRTLEHKEKCNTLKSGPGAKYCSCTQVMQRILQLNHRTPKPRVDK